MSCVVPLCCAILPRDPSSFVLTLKHDQIHVHAQFCGFKFEEHKQYAVSAGRFILQDTIHLLYHRDSFLMYIMVNRETHARAIPPQLLPKDQRIAFQKLSQHCCS
ncbi:Os11g0170400 [Oryza sativa Japonica Group]|uniref:Os11g0170400 protein n=2 Tax=Oryza sativa subsp. japonica TaxID=39947 RepID=B9G9L8_ORYSJ|nr:hypothetical protein OsJ_33117 [Oryza sativa Japonica Group]BAT12863.1 Os11g0170400 [Oryza sativa Japonica Group]